MLKWLRLLVFLRKIWLKSFDFFKRIFYRKKSNYNKADQLRYLSQSVLIEESVAPHMVKTTLVIVSVVVILMIFWAGFTEVEEIAISQGEVIPSQHIQSIQHLEGGIVSKIKVIEGELVNQGDVLLVLDGTAVKQDLSALQAKKTALMYKACRLRSFINQKSPSFSGIIGGNKQLEVEQLKAFKSMIEAKEAEKDIIEQQLLQKKEALNILEAKKTTLDSNVKLIAEEKNLKRQLVEKGHLSKFKYIQIQKQYNDTNGLLKETESAIVQAKNSIDEYQDRLESLSARHVDEAYQELHIVEGELSEIQENVEKVEDQVKRLKIRSPSYGYVKGLNVKTIGGVIESGAVLIEIVPLEDSMIIEAKISPKDIGHVIKGQKVTIKFSAFDFSRYGTVDGKLESISATTFVDEDGTRYYLGRMSLAKNYVGNDPKQNLIVPGMTVQADIVTGSKSILSYLLKPIHSSITSSFTER